MAALAWLDRDALEAASPNAHDGKRLDGARRRLARALALLEPQRAGELAQAGACAAPAILCDATPAWASGTASDTDDDDSLEYTPRVAARARIIVNPASGSATEATLRELRETARWLTEHGLPSELRLTRGPGHATELAREATGAGLEMVVAAGGDGTVNDVIQALAGHTTALGVLPVGTVNVWAREMGISLTATEARETLLHGVRRRVDLGRAGQRYFLMMAGIGFDAEVARRVERGPLKRIGLKLAGLYRGGGGAERHGETGGPAHPDRRAAAARAGADGHHRQHTAVWWGDDIHPEGGRR